MMYTRTSSRLSSCVVLLFAVGLVLSLSGCGFLMHQESSGPTPAQAQRVVKTASSQMGKKYRLGGASPSKGFDCSGLVYWAYQKNGFKVPRVTKDQARAGRAVSRNQLRPGDIVVFRTSRSPRGLHTGIYAGDGTFIHSPRAGQRVRKESLEIKYWKSELITARRIIR